ncbi:sulfurtransferase [Tengunoibacter tsumagoiensis]|uniref:thiosulfate sulfurtransferase n=1 Tax=Tengunoibacter tsumagoiensis TaxID=2014871 RepID=A0A402A101_9CHLR|nr:sulfurtransferase [Tengunoibacter tsumagoiensis]GCE12736.1 sulfurtransferase [Tengunoibacter tsumagoiensis]
MSQERSSFLVETSWLAEHLDDADLRIVDMRGYVRMQPRPGVEGAHDAQYVGAPEEYAHEHIPGAVYLDWSKDIVDLNDEVEAQIALPEDFAAAMGRVGIGDQTLVVAYDAHPASQFATRLWWALRYYGHERVVVLNGGLPKWKSEQRPLATAISSYPPATFTPHVQPQLRATAEDVLTMIGQQGVTLIDARDSGQYTGKVIRGEGRAGHIPGALSLPREELIDPRNGTFRSNEELQRIFAGAHVEPQHHIVAYCNGGVAATTVLFSLAMLGYPQLTNYDGSWNEWGVRQDLPVELP